MPGLKGRGNILKRVSSSLQSLSGLKGFGLEWDRSFSEDLIPIHDNVIIISIIMRINTPFTITI